MLNTWRAMTLWKRVFIGLILGVIVGLGLHYGLGPERGKEIANTWFKPFGDAFVSLIRMLIVPLIVTTLVSGVIAMGDPKRLGSLGVKTIGLYLFTTFFAVWLGIIVASVFQLCMEKLSILFNNVMWCKVNATTKPISSIGQLKVSHIHVNDGHKRVNGMNNY